MTWKKMLQLNPPIPLIVVSKNNAEGQALFLIDYSPQHDLLWVVALDENGEIWVVPNYEIRLFPNWSMKKRIEYR